MAQSLRCKKLKASTQRNLSRNNRISELPDDILIHVLSLLTLKEAGRTCLLSKRWRQLWAYVPDLNFDSCKIIDDLRYRRTSVAEEEPRFFCWVDQVVSSHMAPTIDEFKVCFDLGKSRKDDIDKWVRFATEKRVKRFELNIAPVTNFHKALSYSFPSLSSNSLTVLQLEHVDVTGGVLEKILCDCQALESISVIRSKLLIDLKVVVPPLNLKSLKILLCFEIKHLEISAPNLISFEYDGPKLCWPFKSAPKLAEIYLPGHYGTYLMCNFSDMSSCISQLEVLALEFMYIRKSIPEVYPVCPRLKMLTITLDPFADMQFFGLSALIKACPLLHKFVLKLYSTGPVWKMPKWLSKAEACQHYHLKRVEIFGFVGWNVDIGFATYLIKNAVSLERIIIEPTNFTTPWEFSLEKRKRRARKQAKRLHVHLKPGTELEIR